MQQHSHARSNVRVRHILKTALAALLSVLLVMFFSFPVAAYGAGDDTVDNETAGNAADTQRQETYVTVRYNEHYVHDEDGNPSDAGTRLLGMRTFPATVGDEISTWEYVANIPGFFFWDGWPGTLVVSENPDDNVVELFYMRLSVSTYTVNYYAMTGADLTADNWTDALATKPQFHFLGQNTYTGQLYDKLVSGNKHAVPLEDAYIVGSFPENIRLTLNPSDNVINVLYTPMMAVGPEDMEIVEKPEVTGPDAGDPETPPDDGGDVPDIPDIPDVDAPIVPPSSDEPPIGFPPIDSIVPGGGDEAGDIEITDDMIDKAPTPEQAKGMKDAYESGLHDGVALAKTGDNAVLSVAILAIVALCAAGVVAYIAVVRNKQSR